MAVLPTTPHEATFLFYAGPDGVLEVEVFYADETVWLTQAKMADLFAVDRTVITKHLANIFESRELEELSNVQKMHIAHSAKPVSYYNLDVIISVGYRVNSTRATRFRQWATQTLHSFMIKGFALDDLRLKNGSHFGKDYFEELVERIREIRLSERRLHQKIADIFETASDYQANTDIARTFFAFVQNKMHWAITGKTAAEIIHSRADAKLPHMGLTSWRQSPGGKVLKGDTAIAKNYLDEKELSSLRRIVDAFLTLAEDRAERRIVMRMDDWATFIDQYLALNN